MARITRRIIVWALFGVFAVLLTGYSAEAALKATLSNGVALEDGAKINRHTTVVFQPQDQGAHVTVYLDGAFYAAIGTPFILPLDLAGISSGEHTLRAEAYGAAGPPKETLEVKLTVVGELEQQLLQEGVDLESRLAIGEARTVEVAALSKVVQPKEGEYPPILKYLNRAVTAKVTEIIHQGADKGLPTLERQVQGGTLWTFLPLEDHYGVGSIQGVGQKAQFTIGADGEVLIGTEDAGVTNLGLLRLGLPGKKVLPGESWASEMGVVLDLTGIRTVVATGKHTLTSLDWLEDRECAVIDSEYSLDGPLSVVFGQQPFVLSRVAVQGQRRSYYDFKEGRFLMTRDRVNCWIFLTNEEKEQLEALLKAEEKAPQVFAGAPGGGPMVGPVLTGPRVAGAAGVPSAAAAGAIPTMPSRPAGAAAPTGGQAGTAPSGAAGPAQPMMGPGAMGAGMPAEGVMGEGPIGQGMMGPGMMGAGMTPPWMMAQQPPTNPAAPAATAQPTPPTPAAQPVTPAAQMPPWLSPYLGADGKLTPQAALYLQRLPREQLLALAQQFPDIFSSELRQTLGLAAAGGAAGGPVARGEVLLVKAAALVVNYSLDFLAISK